MSALANSTTIEIMECRIVWNACEVNGWFYSYVFICLFFSTCLPHKFGRINSSLCLDCHVNKETKRRFDSQYNFYSRSKSEVYNALFNRKCLNMSQTFIQFITVTKLVSWTLRINSMNEMIRFVLSMLSRIQFLVFTKLLRNLRYWHN